MLGLVLAGGKGYFRLWGWGFTSCSGSTAGGPALAVLTVHQTPGRSSWTSERVYLEGPQEHLLGVRMPDGSGRVH